MSATQDRSRWSRLSTLVTYSTDRNGAADLSISISSAPQRSTVLRQRATAATQAIGFARCHRRPKYCREGYKYEFSGLSYEEIKAGSTTIYIFMFSITFVFLFLAALYESWSVPFSVLLAVPIGAFGAIFTLILVPSLTDNVYAQIGLITLIGLAAKNAILIVEFAKVRVDRGEELIQSTLEAVKFAVTADHHDFPGIYSGCVAAGVGDRSRGHGPEDDRIYCIGRDDCGLNHGHIYCSRFVCSHHPAFLWQRNNLTGCRPP